MRPRSKTFLGSNRSNKDLAGRARLAPQNTRPKLAELSKNYSLGAAKIGEFNEARMKALSAEFEKEYFTALYSATRNFLFQTTEALHVPNVRILIAGCKSCHASLS